MNEEQLRTHIQEVNTGLIALSQLPTTNRLHELLEAKQSAKDAEAQASTSDKELGLPQPRLKELEGKISECDHRELEEKIRSLEQQLAERAPDQVEMARDLEDA
jgi:phage terminase small subunit